MNEFDEFEKNIRTVLTKQEQLEQDATKKGETLAKVLEDIEAIKKNGPVMATKNIIQPTGIESEFANAFTSPEAKEGFAKLAARDIKEFVLKLDTKDMNFSGNFSSAAAAVSQIGQGIAGPAAKKFHMRNILPAVSMNTRDFVYMREDSVTGGSAMTPESSIKPSVSLNFSQQTATSQYLATTAVISNQMLLDVPDMQSYLESRLLQILLDVEDQQIIGGSGISPNLSGLHVSTNNTQKSGGGSTIPIEELVQGIGQLAALNRQADAIVLHPTDYFSLIINKASTAGLYSLPSIVTTDSQGVVRVAGVPVYWNIAQTVGHFDVLAMALGMLLVTRESMRIEFFVDSTMAAKNSVFIRAELREAFIVKGATYDINGAF